MSSDGENDCRCLVSDIRLGVHWWFPTDRPLFAGFFMDLIEYAAPTETFSEPRRWWTTLAVIAVSLLVFLVASFMLAILGVWIVYGEVTLELLGSPDSLAGVSRSRWGLIVVVVLPQLVLVLPSIAAAFLSPVPLRRRLGLVRGHWPVWAWFSAAAATPLVGLVSGIFVGMFMEESDSLKEISGIFRDHGNSGFLLPLAMIIGLTPALCEEILFRGYVQTRLTKSFHPAVGIFIASFFFAAFHMDLVHVMAVFPLGLFLGLVSWRSGSLFPAMLGHFFNNFISVMLVVMSPEEANDVLAAPTIAASFAIILVGMIGMSATIAASLIYPSGSADEIVLASVVADSSDRPPATELPQ